MPTPKRGPRFGGSAAHQRQILANLATDLFRHGRITTTLAKAKALRPYAEPLITKAKQGDLHARRQVLSKLHDRDVVAYLFDEVAPRFADRNGGYTRILKLGPRRGDNASMAIIELVDRGSSSGEETIEESKAGRSRGLFGRRRRRDSAGAEGQRETAGGTAGAGTAVADEDVFDPEDDEQVRAAVAAATGGAETAEAEPTAEEQDAPAEGTATTDETDESDRDAAGEASADDDNRDA